jgi:hypothetical protein
VLDIQIWEVIRRRDADLRFAESLDEYATTLWKLLYTKELMPESGAVSEEEAKEEAQLFEIVVVQINDLVSTAHHAYHLGVQKLVHAKDRPREVSDLSEYQTRRDARQRERESAYRTWEAAAG